MQKFKEISIGMIKEIDYSAGIGYLITDNNEYMFLTKDIINNIILNKNDLVKFRGEIINGTKRAFFIKKIDRLNNNN